MSTNLKTIENGKWKRNYQQYDGCHSRENFYKFRTTVGI